MDTSSYIPIPHASPGFFAPVPCGQVTVTKAPPGVRGGQAIDVKQQCDKAVAADAALLQMLKELSTQYAEEARHVVPARYHGKKRIPVTDDNRDDCRDDNRDDNRHDNRHDIAKSDETCHN